MTYLMAVTRRLIRSKLRDEGSGVMEGSVAGLAHSCADSAPGLEHQSTRLFSFPLFIQSRTPVHGTALRTFTAGLPQ